MSEPYSVIILAAIVLLGAGLISGFVDRAPLSQPMIFLGVGILLGPRVFNIVRIGPHDRLLEVVGVLTLALVLFIDGLNLRIDEIGSEWTVPVLALGPGAFITIALLTVVAVPVFHLSITQGLLVGVVLASTDAVLLRDVVRDKRIPASIRRALAVEGATNDIIILPAILILIAVSQSSGRSVIGWIIMLIQLFVLAPVAGVAVGYAGAWLMGQVDRRVDVSREYQSLYGLGIVFAAYGVGELVGGSGFIAAFAAGAIVSVADIELCDCFVEYGEVTAEMAMLVAFILFGALLSTLTNMVDLLPAFLFAVFALVIVRPIAMGLVLRRAVASSLARRFLGWFGPRGLGSLLFALLIIQRDIAGSVKLLAIVGMVVVVSVVAHGVSAGPLARGYQRKISSETLPEEREDRASGIFKAPADEIPRITPAELERRLLDGLPTAVLDVRTTSQYRQDPRRIPGSVRVEPGEITHWAAEASRNVPVVAYCT